MPVCKIHELIPVILSQTVPTFADVIADSPGVAWLFQQGLRCYIDALYTKQTEYGC